MFRQSPDKDATYTVQSRSERALTPEAAFLARTAPEDRLRLGQVFTPPALAQAMVAWIAPLRPTSILDPAVGTGALLAAWRAWEAQRGEGASPAILTGYDVDGRALDLARGRLSGDVRLAQASALSEGLRGGLEDQDAVLANPPFVRAGWCAPETRAEMQALALRLGVPLGPRANLYLAVALAGLAALRPGGRAALLLPASALTSEAARDFREALHRGWLKGVLRLPPGARPFPGHSVGACLLQIERPPRSSPGPLFASPPTSRAPGRATRTVPAAPDGLTPLADLAVVRRGLATGANGFFHISDATVARWGLLPSACLACIGRAADAPGHDVTQDTLQGLREAGRPTWLFAPGRRAEAIDGASDAYLEHGCRIGIPHRALPRRRTPWYKPEGVAAAPLWMTTFGRLDDETRAPGRVVRNGVGALHLTAFHGLYPHRSDAGFVAALAEALRAPVVRAQTIALARDQGGGLGKLEPGDIARLRVPILALYPRASSARTGSLQTL